MIRMELGKNSYNIELERGNLAKAGRLLNLNRKVMIITDEGVPRAYAETIVNQSKEAYIKVVPQGEGSKSLQTAEEILTEMLEHQFSRMDCVVAVGGGVVVICYHFLLLQKRFSFFAFSAIFNNLIIFTALSIFSRRASDKKGFKSYKSFVLSSS